MWSDYAFTKPPAQTKNLFDISLSFTLVRKNEPIDKTPASYRSKQLKLKILIYQVIKLNLSSNEIPYMSRVVGHVFTE